MSKRLWMMLLGFGLALNGYALNIDDDIATELGLVPQTTHSGSSRITVELLLNQSRELVFPSQVKLTMQKRNQRKFEINNVNNSVHISPTTKITEPVIGIFTRKDNQKSYLIEFKTVNAYANYDAVLIDTPTETAIITSSQKTVKRVPVPGPTRRQRSGQYDDYVTLTRFVTQTLYAPDRVVALPKGAEQVALPKRLKLTHLSRQNGLRFTTMSSFAYRGLFATALKVENRQDHVVELTPDLIRGKFIGKLFRHASIGTHDDDRYSALVLLSQHPFEMALAEELR